jgi:hypothetical protein
VPDLIEGVALELARVFSPLTVALESEEELALFLRRFGISFDADDLAPAAANLVPLGSGVRALATAAQEAADGDLAPEDIGPLFEQSRALFGSLSTLSGNFSGLPSDAMTPQALAESLAALPEELFELLVADYLDIRVPAMLYLLNLLDVYRPQVVDESVRGLSYVRHEFDWSRIRLLFDDPEGWARAAYGWGVDLESDELIWRVSRLIEFIGGAVHVAEMNAVEQAVFLPDWPNPVSPPNMARAPFVRKLAVADDGSFDAAASGEAGVALFPVSGISPPGAAADRGLGVGPYLEGDAGASADLDSGFSVRVNGSLGAVGGIVFALRPSGVDVSTGIGTTAFSGAFTVELTKQPAAGESTLRLVGRAGGSRVEAKSVTAALGGEISSTGHDLFVAAGVAGLKLVADASNDGFVGRLLPSPVEIDAGDVLAGWREGRGVYFEGGSKLAVTIHVNRTIGPVKIYKLGLELDLTTDPAVTAMVTADGQLGPLYAYVEGLGLTVTLVPNDQGALGKHDLAFGLKLPTGYAIALEAAGIEGGGFLSVRDTQYRGALALRFATLGFSAFAILDTKLPGGQRGFSFVASIFGDFVLPLGYGFFLTGLGGLIGINRTVNSQALREVLYGGELDGILFPADPIANAATILDNVAAIFPAHEGQHVFGPIARIAFNQPPLIEGKIGVIIEIGGETRLLLLGALQSELPTKDAPLVVLRLDFFGEIDFGAETISFDATLRGSRVLSYGVSGEIAVRSGWAPRIEHVISFGGLHPQYPRPPNLPDLRRLSINFGTDNPRVTLTAYMAVTLNTLQFGARGELYAKGPKIRFVGRLAAEGNAFFDALIYFDPFAFDAKLGGSLALLVDGDEVMGLGFSLRLTGPNTFVIDGRVWATVFGIDVGFGVHHRWGDELAVPAPVVDAVALLTRALTDKPVLESTKTVALADGVRFVEPKRTEERRALSPAGGARFVQRVLPLGPVIEKVGEVALVGPLNQFDLQVSAGGHLLSPRPAMLDFVRGHFWAISEGERLRAVAFESHKAGFELAAGDVVVEADQAIAGDYDYEIVVIGDDEAQPPLVRPGLLDAALLDTWISAAHLAHTAPLDGVSPFAPHRADAVSLMPPAYVTVAPGGVITPGRAFETFSAAQLAAVQDTTVVAANPVISRYLSAQTA